MPQEISVINKISKKVSELTVDDISQYCAEAGITVQRLCVDLDRLLKAKRPKYDRDGEWVRDDDNHEVQLKSLSVALELLKLTGVKTEGLIGVVQHQMAPGDIDRLEDIARELKGLESRLVADKVQQGVIIDTIITV